MLFCKCGCGLEVMNNHFFIRGHNRKGKKLEPEHRKILKETNLGKHRSEETKQKISEKIKLLYQLKDNPYKDSNQKRSQKMKSYWNDPTSKLNSKETKLKQREINLRNRENGLYSSVEFKNKLQNSHKQIWNDPESSYNSKDRSNKIRKKMKELFLEKWFLDRMQKGLKTKPNKLEKLVFSILQSCNCMYIFVGNGKFWIGGKNPDFINLKEKRIIEVFGDYWHDENKANMSKEEHEKQRIKHFQQYNYKCLVLWEHELNNINSIFEKIYSFEER